MQSERDIKSVNVKNVLNRMVNTGELKREQAAHIKSALGIKDQQSVTVELYAYVSDRGDYTTLCTTPNVTAVVDLHDVVEQLGLAYGQKVKMTVEKA